MKHPDSGHLKLLARITQSFSQTTDIDLTLDEGLQRIMEYMDVEAASIFVFEDEDKTLVCKACAGPIDVTGLRLPADEGIVGKAASGNSPVAVLDAYADTNFTPMVDEMTGFVSRSLVAAPLLINDRRLGVIEIINRREGGVLFNEGDVHRLEVLATAIALALNNADMLSRLVEQERVAHELQLAREIQNSLMPAPRPAPFPIEGLNRPMREVSGDFYDFFDMREGRIGFNLADVSGKGMNAALMGAKASSLLRALGQEIEDPALLLERVNNELAQTATRGMFVTVIAGWYEPESGWIRLANAGHQAPLIWRDGEFEMHESSGPPLGIMSGMSYETLDFELGDGRLYLYTDGLSEARLTDGSELDLKGVKGLLDDGPGIPDLYRRFEALNAHCHDDLTLMAIGQRQASEQLLFEKEWKAEPCSLKAMRHELVMVLDELALPDKLRDDLVLAVGEAAMNVVQHSYAAQEPGSLCLEIGLQENCAGKSLQLRLLDDAPTIDTACLQGRDLDDLRPGGLGLYFIQGIMDRVEFSPRSTVGGNQLLMTKQLPTA